MILLIEVDHVIKEFKDIRAVDDVCLTIPRGAFLALLGPNGAGKTTLISMLTSLMNPTSGEIRIAGQKVHKNNIEVKKLIGIVPQHINLDKELDARENLIFTGKLYGIHGQALQSKVDKMLEFAGLTDVSGRMSKNLSGGMQRKLMIVRALLPEPDILILDEPTVGVDLNARRRIWDMLKELQGHNKTILLTTHYIEEAEQLCDTIALMDLGRISHVDSAINLIKKLGDITLESYDASTGTVYEYFHSMVEAREKAVSKDINKFIIRNTGLEDVFYEFINGKALEVSNDRRCFMA